MGSGFWVLGAGNAAGAARGHQRGDRARRGVSSWVEVLGFVFRIFRCCVFFIQVASESYQKSNVLQVCIFARVASEEAVGVLLRASGAGATALKAFPEQATPFKATTRIRWCLCAKSVYTTFAVVGLSAGLTCLEAWYSRSQRPEILFGRAGYWADRNLLAIVAYTEIRNEKSQLRPKDCNP